MDAQQLAHPDFQRRIAQGRTFRRLDCDRCGARFHFTESPRVTRVPVCPQCGSLQSHDTAA